jgi:RecA/RadA recombinase
VSSEVMVALLSLAGTLGGSLLGALASNRLVVYRLEQLERKVDKHNSVVERVALVEKDVSSAFRQINMQRDEIREMREEMHGEH